MICPYCGKEMEKGYIKSGRNIHFDTNKDNDLPALSESAIPLGNYIRYNRIECYHCVICNKFIFEL